MEKPIAVMAAVDELVTFVRHFRYLIFVVELTRL